MKIIGGIVTIFIIVSLVVITSFFYNLSTLFKIPSNFNDMTSLGQLGDFFSGHLNGFVLMILAVSLVLQRRSIEQFQESLEDQREANKSMQEDIKRQTNLSSIQTKQLILSNISNDYYKEKEDILKLETELKLGIFFEKKFNNFIVVDTRKLAELLNKIEYMKRSITNDMEDDLKGKITLKLSILLSSNYTDSNIKMLRKLLVANKLCYLFQLYINFIKKNCAKYPTWLENTDQLNTKYLFLKEFITINSIELNEHAFKLFNSLNIIKYGYINEDILWTEIRQLENIDLYYITFQNIN